MIEGIPFSNVLIIENKPAEIQTLEEDLKKNNISVTFAKSSTQAKSILKLRPELNLIILDWLLNEQDDIEAKELLLILRKQTFAPVVIYTDKATRIPSEFIKENGLERIAIVLNKHEVKGDCVFKKLTEWLTQEPELKIFLRWAREVERGLNQTLWSIHDLEIGGVRALIKVFNSKEEKHLPVEEELISFFGKILTRQIASDANFLKSIEIEAEALSKKDANLEIDADMLRRFYASERYKMPNSRPI